MERPYVLWLGRDIGGRVYWGAQFAVIWRNKYAENYVSLGAAIPQSSQKKDAHARTPRFVAFAVSSARTAPGLLLRLRGRGASAGVDSNRRKPRERGVFG